MLSHYRFNIQLKEFALTKCILFIMLKKTFICFKSWVCLPVFLPGGIIKDSYYDNNQIIKDYRF